MVRIAQREECSVRSRQDDWRERRYGLDRSNFILYHPPSLWLDGLLAVVVAGRVFG
jgi:hypothetical protein